MNLYQIFKFVNNPLIIILRVIVFCTFVTVIFLTINNDQTVDIPLYLYSLFIINELFIHLKINNSKPEKNVYEAQNSLLALDWRVKSSLDKMSVKKYISEIKNKPPQKFFQKKVGEKIGKIIEIEKDNLIEKAHLLAKSSNATYISEIEIFAAYILIQEPKTKYLESQNITTEDIPFILFWTRKKFPPGIEKKDDLPFTGSGTFDFFVYGWNAELKKYAYDFTQQSVKWGASAHAVGRSEEYSLLVKSLSKNKNNNALLIGDPGVGKTSLVAFFARQTYLASVPGKVSKARIFALALDRLVAGADTQGELEKRVTLLLEEITHSGNVIVYTPNVELLFGGGGLSTDLSGALYEYLKSSKIQIIGTTTPEQYETVIKPHSASASLFENILMRQPDEKSARFMVFESIRHLEKAYKASFTYTAITTAIDYADKYQTGLALPGSALVLLEDTAAGAGKKENISADYVLATIQQKTDILLKEPGENEKNTLLKLEETLRQMVIGQENALTSIADALRRARSGFQDENKPIASFLFLGPTGVGKTQTAKALAASYFGDSENMIRLDMSEYNTQDSAKKLLGEMPGEDYIESLIAKVQERPFSLILLDEFEKADPKVLNLFLQILDDARLTNNKGETASFENSIIIATSNAGSEFIRKNLNDPNLNKNLQEYLMNSNIFKPELLNRFTETITFAPLTRDEIRQVIALDLQDTLQKLKDDKITITFDQKALDKIAYESYDQNFGARNTKRYIEKNIESLIAKVMLEDTLKKGGQATITLDSQGNFVIQ